MIGSNQPWKLNEKCVHMVLQIGIFKKMFSDCEISDIGACRCFSLLFWFFFISPSLQSPASVWSSVSMWYRSCRTACAEPFICTARWVTADTSSVTAGWLYSPWASSGRACWLKAFSWLGVQGHKLPGSPLDCTLSSNWGGRNSWFSTFGFFQRFAMVVWANQLTFRSV